MSRSFPAAALALLVGVCFGYAAYGVAAVLGGIVLGYRLWPLELFAAGLAAWATWRLFGRTYGRQETAPRLDRGRRAIERLAYRRGPVLDLTDIVRDTLLDEGAALAALRAMEADGAATREPDGRWRVGSIQPAPTRAAGGG